MKSLSALCIAAGMVVGSSSAFAQQTGVVTTQTKTGNVAQAADGQDNQNKVAVGAVKLKDGAKVGMIQSNTATGSISQAVRGKDNKNEVKIGTVE